MAKEVKKVSITSEELAASLMLMSETAKALAQEVMLIPESEGKEKVEDGGEKNADKSVKAQ